MSMKHFLQPRHVPFEVVEGQDDGLGANSEDAS